MKYELKMNENVMIGTAILSMYYDKKQKDIIDLMLPFIKYTLHEKFNLGDKVGPEEVHLYLQENFNFQELPLAIVTKSLDRLSKKGGCLAYNNQEYHFNADVSNEHSNIKRKRQQAMGLIDSIINKLTPYVNNRAFKKYSEDDIKQALFGFLDKYGLSAYEQKFADVPATKNEYLNRIIGLFILDERDAQSAIFDNLVDLIKGIFISKAIYLQSNNNYLFKAKMKDVIMILDAPLLLRILGLKTEGENRTAKEFLQSVPPQVKIRYFQQNFNELESIIRSYKHRRVSGGGYNHTLEYFDEKNYSMEDIELFYIQLEKKLRSFNITEFTDDIPLSPEYIIDEKGLSEYLKEKIPSYNSNEKALETDIATIANICRLRKGKRPSTIENCIAIFITNNYNLTSCVNNFLKEYHSVGCVMTETDFTVLMWLKNGAKNNVPKDILVANALAATEEITETFMSGVLAKIQIFRQEDTFDEENAGLILENIYCRRELAEKCNGNPEMLTFDDFQSVQTKYEQKIIQQAGYDNVKLSSELELLKSKQIEAEKSRTELVDKIIDEAKRKASKNSKCAKISIAAVIIGLFAACGIIGIVKCIFDAFNKEVNILAIIGIAFAILGIVDLIIGKMRFVLKFSTFVAEKVYFKTYDKHTKVLKN